ncbi:hypothetical protein MKW92_018261, partial [Papaver armeniacum]
AILEPPRDSSILGAPLFPTRWSRQMARYRSATDAPMCHPVSDVIHVDPVSARGNGDKLVYLQGLHGRTDGSNNIGHGTVTQGNSLRERGSLKSMRGRLRAKQGANVGKGLATAKLHVRPKGDLKKGNSKIEEGTGSVGVGRGLVKKDVGAKKGVNLQKKKKHTTYRKPFSREG